MKGLVCAGGEATRLGELTRVTNKHLLPVGRWPMVYYPLQLLQRAGVREVLLVTGKRHAGQIHRPARRRAAARARRATSRSSTLDLTYKVQTEPGGIAQVVGMARDFAAGEKLVVVLGDNIFEYAQADAISRWGRRRRRADLRQGRARPGELRRRRLRRGRAASPTSSRRRASSTLRYDAPPSNDAVVGLYCYPPDVFDDHRRRSSRRAAASSRSPTSTASYAGAGSLDVAARRGLVAGRRQALAAPRRHRPADRARPA